MESAIPHLFYHPKISLNQPKPPPLKISDCAEKLSVTAAYSDPFTTLSTALFQDYEPFHTWKDVKDNPYRDASKYQLVLQDDTLVAKPINDKKVSKETIQATLKTYQNYLYAQFGTAVCKRIQTHYEFSLDEMIKNATPLTPEIVYRMNIGTSYVEASDVDQLAKDLTEGNPLSNRLAKKVANTTLPPTIDTNKPEHFEVLMNLLQVDETESKNIFTGRMLHGKISSWYTQGDESLFKPWVDQQEFLQTCLKIPKRNANCFYEDISMILCKKHLHQKNADGTYRVGALIPAPKKEGQPQLYYKVTSWIHNSRGIYSYTLEPATLGTSLAAIKLYRSTSVSAYNLDGAASYKNDFNPINPPGYEGSHLLEPYEKDFFAERTIPVWVGYQDLADKKQSSPDEMRTLLSQATNALISDIESKYIKPTLKQYIRKYDSEFMELIHACRDSGLIWPYKAWYLLNNSLRNTVKFKYDANSAEVLELKKFLEQAAQKPEFAQKATALLSWWNWEKREPTQAEKNLITDLQSHKITCSLQMSPEDAKQKLQQWSQFIHQYAVRKKEDIASKSNQSLTFAGHSLGAACAQRFLVYYTAAKGRMPLPGHTISARLFDDPAINKEDNKTFIEFGNKHADLLKAQNATFSIIRRQETGDPVPQSGEIHLGAAKTEEQQKQMYRWLRFDATLQKPSSQAKDPQIRDYTTAHGRLFAAGSPRGAWIRSWLHTRIPQLQKTDPATAAKLSEELKKIGTADYKIIHYDSRTQWNFDRPSSGRMWAHLRALWKLPFQFTPIYAERLRTYLSAAFRSGFFRIFLPKFIAQLGQNNPPDDKAHGDWQKHCDKKGVFVVPRTAPRPQIEE